MSARSRWILPGCGQDTQQAGGHAVTSGGQQPQGTGQPPACVPPPPRDAWPQALPRCSIPTPALSPCTHSGDMGTATSAGDPFLRPAPALSCSHCAPRVARPELQKEGENFAHSSTQPKSHSVALHSPSCARSHETGHVLISCSHPVHRARSPKIWFPIHPKSDVSAEVGIRRTPTRP